MERYSKNDVIAKICQLEPTLKKSEVKNVLNALASAVVELLTENPARGVPMGDLGTFSFKDVPERTCGFTKQVVAAHRKVAFKLAAGLKALK